MFSSPVQEEGRAKKCIIKKIQFIKLKSNTIKDCT